VQADRHTFLGGARLSSLSNLSLIATQAETLFVSDAAGRLLFVNEPFDPMGTPAPLLFVGQSDDGFLCRFRHDIPVKLCEDVESIVERFRTKPSARSASLCRILQQRLEISGFRNTRIFEGPAYCFMQAPKQDPECVVVDTGEASLLRRHLSEIIPELGANAPCVVLTVGGDAVSVCRTVRRSAHAAEAGVFTADSYRGRGFASRVTGHWASIVSSSGLMPLYSTSWDNHASQSVARKLELVQYGTDLSLLEDNQDQP
jgi:hypothetical protein